MISVAIAPTDPPPGPRFACDDGNEINARRVCDFWPDCPGDSDEVDSWFLPLRCGARWGYERIFFS